MLSAEVGRMAERPGEFLQGKTVLATVSLAQATLPGKEGA